MEVFSKSYLEEVIENQGKLFEYAEEHYPGIDVADFIESYMKSYTRTMVDEGQAYVCTMDAETLYNYFLENDKYERLYFLGERELRRIYLCQCGRIL